MLVKDSTQSPKAATDTDISKIITQVDADELERLVTRLAVPRHFQFEREANKRTAQWLKDQFSACGYESFLQGPYNNVIARPKKLSGQPLLIAAAHYDTVPGSPGADDNGSGSAALLASARILAQHSDPQATMFVVFNCEEDGLLGSREFVSEYLPQHQLTIAEVNVMEMVGYCSHAEGSQYFPAGLPVQLPTTGNFLGLIGNQHSNRITDELLHAATNYIDELPVTGLKIYLGIEKFFPHLSRSDHSPFWQAKIPALMWTDTAEFRNKNYHGPGDRPETLDYQFLKKVTQLLLTRILGHEQRNSASK